MTRQIFIFVFSLMAFHAIFAQGLVLDKSSIDALEAYPEPQGKGSRGTTVPLRKSLEMEAGTALNQGNTMACLCYAMAQAWTMMEAHDRGWKDANIIDKSALNPLSAYCYVNKRSCEQPLSIEEGEKVMKTQGMCLESAYPSTSCTEKPDANAQKDALNHRIIKTLSLFPTQINDNAYKIRRIKQAITADLPVVIGVRMDNGLRALKNNQGKYWRVEATEGNICHAMVIIGYDDHRDGGSFQILNSWGTDWGNKGMCYVKYEDFIKQCVMAVVLARGNAQENLITDNQPAPKPQPNPLPITPKTTKKMKGEMEFLYYAGWDDKKDSAIFESAEVIYNPKSEDFEMEKTWSLGQQFQISTLVQQKGMWVYVFSYDPKGKADLHYPTEEEVKSENKLGAIVTVVRKQSAFMPTDSIKLTLPSPDLALELDEIGQDNICVLFSSEEITDMSAILDKLKTSSGLVEDRLNKILGDRLIPKKNIKYNTANHKISFSAESDKGYIVPLILKADAK